MFKIQIPNKFQKSNSNISITTNGFEKLRFEKLKFIWNL